MSYYVYFEIKSYNFKWKTIKRFQKLRFPNRTVAGTTTKKMVLFSAKSMINISVKTARETTPVTLAAIVLSTF